jgi:hypothetical protein
VYAPCVVVEILLVVVMAVAMVTRSTVAEFDLHLALALLHHLAEGTDLEFHGLVLGEDTLESPDLIDVRCKRGLGFVQLILQLTQCGE